MTEDAAALTAALGQAISTARTIDHALANLNQLIATSKPTGQETNHG